MLRASLQLTTRDVTTGNALNRTFGNINRSYIKEVGVNASSPTPVEVVILPGNYETFWEWADAVGRRLNSLSANTFIDVTVTAGWSTTEELNN